MESLDVVRFEFISFNFISFYKCFKIYQDLWPLLRALKAFKACDCTLWDALVSAEPWVTQSLTPIEPLQRQRWSIQLASAVAHCHHLHVLHRVKQLEMELLFIARISILGTCFSYRSRLPSLQSLRHEDSKVLKGLKGLSKGRVRHGLWHLRLADFGSAVQIQGHLEGLEARGAAPLDDSALNSLYSAPELGVCYGACDGNKMTPKISNLIRLIRYLYRYRRCRSIYTSLLNENVSESPCVSLAAKAFRPTSSP